MMVLMLLGTVQLMTTSIPWSFHQRGCLGPRHPSLSGLKYGNMTCAASHTVCVLPFILLMARIACPHRCHLRLARKVLKLAVLMTLWPISCSSSQGWSRHCSAVRRLRGDSLSSWEMKSCAFSDIRSNSSKSKS